MRTLSNYELIDTFFKYIFQKLPKLKKKSFVTFAFFLLFQNIIILDSQLYPVPVIMMMTIQIKCRANVCHVWVWHHVSTLYPLLVMMIGVLRHLRWGHWAGIQDQEAAQDWGSHQVSVGRRPPAFTSCHLRSSKNKKEYIGTDPLLKLRENQKPQQDKATEEVG